MAVAVAMGATSCNEDEDLGQATDGPPNRRVEVELAYSLGEGLGDMADVVIMYPITHFEDSAVCDTLSSGQTWTKTLTYDTPATVGMIVSPLREADATPASAITVQYEYSCTVRLMEGNSVVDIKEHSSSEELTLNYGNDSLFYEQLAAVLDLQELFSVDDNGITEIDYTIDDSDLVEAGGLPEEDEENVTMANTLYYVSTVDLATDHQFLHDNMVARFSDRRQYTAGQELSKGDFLFLKGGEANSVDKEALRASAANGAIFILDEIDSYQTLADFCTTIEAHNFVPEGTDVAGDLFIIADAAVNLSDNDSSPYSRLFYRLSPRDDEGNHVSDYTQGHIIDQALASIQKALYGTGTSTNFLNASTRSTDDELQEMTELVAATKLYLSYTHTLGKNDYQNPGKADITGDVSNVYSVEYDIWNAYSIDEGRNYYYIHQEIMCSFGNCYAGVYNAAVTTDGCHTIAKVCQWYGKEIETTTTPYGNGALNMVIHRSSPETTQSSTSYTSGFSWNLSGGGRV